MTALVVVEVEVQYTRRTYSPLLGCMGARTSLSLSLGGRKGKEGKETNTMGRVASAK